MSIENLNENLNVVGENDDPALTALVISLLDADMNVIQKLDDEPNDVGGLTAAELKAKFDEAGNTIKDYINNVLLPGVSDTAGEAQVRAAAEEERVAAETARAAAEEERVAAEAARAAAETARQDLESGYVAQAQYWAEFSKDAAGGNADLSVLGGARFAAGSYSGIGTYGQNNPNRLTFDFAPKVLVIYGAVRTHSNSYAVYPMMMLCAAGEYSFCGDGLNVKTYGKVTVEGNTVSWYTTNTEGDWTGEEYDYTIVPYGQMNGAGKTYYYAALG